MLTDEQRGVLEKERDTIADAIANAELLMAYLQPEMDKFKARSEPHNIYVVRMYVDHLSINRTNRKLLDAINGALTKGTPDAD